MIIYIGGLSGDNGYSLLLRVYGSVLPKAFPHAIVSAAVNFGLRTICHPDYMDYDIQAAFPSASAYTPFSLCLAFLLVFRSSQAYARYVEATQHCFHVRAQLSNACMLMLALSKQPGPDASGEERARIEQAQTAFHRRHRRLCYAFQRAAMQELRGEHDFAKLIKLTTLLPTEAERLLHCHNRPLRLMQWMTTSAAEHYNAGLFTAPPPVMARVYGHLTTAMNHLDEGYRIARTPFPFPYAQLSMFFLLLQQITLPVLLLVFVNGRYVSACLSAMATWMFFSMHLVSVELESPFGYDWNDLPLDWYSEEVMEDIKTVYEEGSCMPWHSEAKAASEQVRGVLKKSVSRGRLRTEQALDDPSGRKSAPGEVDGLMTAVDEDEELMSSIAFEGSGGNVRVARQRASTMTGHHSTLRMQQEYKEHGGVINSVVNTGGTIVGGVMKTVGIHSATTDAADSSGDDSDDSHEEVWSKHYEHHGPSSRHMRNVTHHGPGKHSSSGKGRQSPSRSRSPGAIADEQLIGTASGSGGGAADADAFTDEGDDHHHAAFAHQEGINQVQKTIEMLRKREQRNKFYLH